jgi:hypothetical protein
MQTTEYVIEQDLD